MVTYFDKVGQNEIIEAIRQAERKTSGEIRVHVQIRCGEDIFTEAKNVFKKLEMHLTDDRNGVLIFVVPAKKRFAILGDKGIHERVGEGFWNKTRDKMVSYFEKDQIKEGILAGIESAGDKLREHFPVSVHDRDELSNDITQG